AILAANPEQDYELVCHVDPEHDRSLVRVVHFVRVKLHDLPGCYRDFIASRLAPGGALILIDCDYSWPQYVLGERRYLQVGGLGAIAADDYGSRWPLDLPLEQRRESEWGCPPQFAAAAERFAVEVGAAALPLHYDHPATYSLLARDAFAACAGARRHLLMIDSFNHFNPRTNLATGIPPLWLPFNTIDGLDLVRRATEGEASERFFLIPLPSFTRSPDTASLGSWRELLTPRGEVEFLGVSPRLYPADPLAPYRLARDLQALRTRYLLEVPVRMDVAAFLAFARHWPANCAEAANSVSLLRELRLAAGGGLR
ncbi:MAG: hypothetical protein JSW65_01090, partial [Candidatus Bipolaricaulota bacterium]